VASPVKELALAMPSQTLAMTASRVTDGVRARSLRGWLLALTLSILGSALVAAAVLLFNAYAHERRALERQISETASAMGLVVDRQIGQQRVLLSALAAAPALHSGDWKGFDAFARAAIAGKDTSVVVLRNGHQLVNTRLAPGARLPVTPQETSGVTWSGPVGDGVRVSNLFHRAGDGAPIIVVSKAVTLADGLPANVAVSTSSRTFSRIWREQGFPPTWTGVVVDGRGFVISRSRGGDAFVGRSASEAMKAHLASALAGVADTWTLDGVRSVTAWSRAPGYGWSFIVAVPANEVAGAATRSLGLAALAGVLLLAAGVAGAAWISRRITQPMRTLTAAAELWEHGEAPALPPSGVAELDALGAAFAASAQRLAAHQAELRQLNASLETRVAERTRELAEATETLVQAQKLEAMGRLTGGIAHDFNNLLMGVLGNLELLSQRVTDERLTRYIDHARQAADRGAKLTTQLLAFSRKQRLEPLPMDVNALVASSAGLLGSTLGGGVRVETVLKPDLWPAMADATQLELVILNLALNARDAMPMGGVVTIETSNVVRDQPQGRPEEPPPGEFVMVAVSDTGVGMTPEILARVFEPFFTTKGVGQGTGLGLPQVLGLAKQLGGGVEIVTAPGRGASIRVYLPRSRAAALPGTEGGGDEPVRMLSGARVLLVDDDTDVRAVTGAILTEHGCVVTQAASGLAALDVAASGRPLDVVLLDFAMPGMNGGETAARLRERRPELPIVMMSGFADVEMLAANWSGPLLHKPFTAAALCAQIGTVTGSGNVIRLRS
jgi:signal transduction histidine kinase